MGTGICILVHLYYNISWTIQLHGFGCFVMVILLSVMMYGFCCIAELICNKMRSSEINLYSSKMQLELSEIDLNYLKFTLKFLKLT